MYFLKVLEHFHLTCVGNYRMARQTICCLFMVTAFFVQGSHSKVLFNNETDRLLRWETDNQDDGGTDYVYEDEDHKDELPDYEKDLLDLEKEVSEGKPGIITVEQRSARTQEGGGE